MNIKYILYKRYKPFKFIDSNILYIIYKNNNLINKYIYKYYITSLEALKNISHT